MKPPILLKTILDVCFIFLVFTFLSAVIFVTISLFEGGTIIPIELNGGRLSTITPTTSILLFAELISGGMVLYTVFVLKKLVRNFLKNKLFTALQIASLNLIGKLIIFITIWEVLITFFGRLLLESKAEIGITLDLSFGSFWFILAIGLFFIYLSKIFRNAKDIKEENELTV